MKTSTCLNAASVLLIILTITSCATSKRMALPCPAPEGKYKNRTVVHNLRKAKNLGEFSKKEMRWNRFGYTYTSRTSMPMKHEQRINYDQIPTSMTKAYLTDSVYYVNNLYAVADGNTIQSEINSKHTKIYPETSSDESWFNKYEKTEPVSLNSGVKPFIILHKHIDEIVNPAYNVPVISIPQDSTKTKTHPKVIGGAFATLAGMILLPAGFEVFVWLAPLVSVVVVALSLISSILGIKLSRKGLKEIKKSPGKFKGRGLALAGLIGSIVILVLGIAFFIAGGMGLFESI